VKDYRTGAIAKGNGSPNPISCIEIGL